MCATCWHGYLTVNVPTVCGDSDVCRNLSAIGLKLSAPLHLGADARFQNTATHQ